MSPDVGKLAARLEYMHAQTSSRVHAPDRLEQSFICRPGGVYAMWAM